MAAVDLAHISIATAFASVVRPSEAEETTNWLLPANSAALFSLSPSPKLAWLTRVAPFTGTRSFSVVAGFGTTGICCTALPLPASKFQ